MILTRGVDNMQLDETIVTKNLLRFCYTCDHAHACDSEELSKECWSDLDVESTADSLENAAGQDLTAELLRQYAL